MSTTLTVRLDEQTKKRLDRLANATDRSKSFLVSNAIKGFLDINEWQVQEIKKAVGEAERAGAKFVEHEEVAAWLGTWGSDKEKKPPK
ncbi:MAG: CopG family ribbon-helix-helix protein [Thermodesulfovibrionales bacterium]|nr:CopG family ribbon-helix-helix protein [Thermodesulfovibrionales bacterium]